MYLKPYKEEIINTLEYREITTSVVTFFGSLFFVSEDMQDTVRLAFLALIIVFNIWFLSLWVFCALSQFGHYKIARITAFFFRYLSLLPLEKKSLQKEYDVDSKVA